MQIQQIDRSRVIVLTDITNEPDDEQSMVRFLCYVNEFDVEGVVATTSCWLRNRVAPEQIEERVTAYDQVRNNLLTHAPNYPPMAFLMDRIKTGLPVYGMDGVGQGKMSAGSQLIIEAIDKPDPRPVWVCVWGGVNCLAQALWEVQQSRSPAEVDRFISKLRVYTISDQDNSAPWIRQQFPNLFYIVSPGYEENGGGGYHHSTWVGISGDKFHGRFEGANFEIVDNPWLDQHIRQNHGPLGAFHPRTKYLLEGDTPTFLYLVPNGLGVPEQPNYGSWGGRYEFYTPDQQPWHYQQETHPIWTDTTDWVIGTDDKIHQTNKATIWRWREAYQHDFAARIDWTTTDRFQDANHNPIAGFAGDTSRGVVHLTARSGEAVQLDATGTTDPDGDQVSVDWFQYKEVGSLEIDLKIEVQSDLSASFVAPQVEQVESVHIILEAKDSGEPCLYNYRRIVVEIQP